MKIGDTIDKKYKIVDLIGEGGMGRVYKVECKKNFFALKICVDKDPDSITRFKREVRLMQTIEHENVIEIINANLEHEPPYFVMPLCKFSVDTKIEKLNGNPELTIELLLQVCKGINAIHLSGVIHRDIKPKNILVDQDNKIKVSDLGLGKFSVRDSSIITSSNVYMGTQGYIPPEFFRTGGTKNADIRSDIYQMGKTIYNIFTNSNPVLIEKDKLPGGLLYIIQTCIADNPDDRYKSISDLENALSNYHLALHPENNPLNAFENLINIAKQNIALNQFDRQNAEDIIKTLFTFKDETDLFFQKSNIIPIKLLEAIASNYQRLTKDFLSIYTSTTTKHFKESRIDFSDAEPVSKIMEAIFRGTKDIEIKVHAMQMTLFVSSFCNRYSAMSIFDTMLQSIKTDQEAVAVAEMLKNSWEYYVDLYDRVPAKRLNPLIQKVQKEIRDKKEKEEMKKASEFEGW